MNKLINIFVRSGNCVFIIIININRVVYVANFLRVEAIYFVCVCEFECNYKLTLYFLSHAASVFEACYSC